LRSSIRHYAHWLSVCLHHVITALLLYAIASSQLQDKRLRPYYASLAYQVQNDLETVATDYATQLRLKIGGNLNMTL
jgi:hypothetical protein